MILKTQCGIGDEILFRRMTRVPAASSPTIGGWPLRHETELGDLQSGKVHQWSPSGNAIMLNNKWYDCGEVHFVEKLA